jgi:hypothetical protein
MAKILTWASRGPTTSPKRQAGAIARAQAKARPGGQARAAANKSKQKCLDLLGFIRPNRDFSMGYGRKNKKIPHLKSRAQTTALADTLSDTLLHTSRRRTLLTRRGSNPMKRNVAHVFWF